MQSLKTHLTLYLRTHQYVDCELFFPQGYQCLWVDRGLCVSTAASPAATYKPATAAGEKKKRELAILNGLYKNHTFRLLLDYSNSFFVLAVNPLYRFDFNHEWLPSFCSARFTADGRCLHYVCMLCPAAQYAVGAPCNLSIDIRHNLLQANTFYKKKSFPVAAFNLRSIECNAYFPCVLSVHHKAALFGLRIFKSNNVH